MARAEATTTTNKEERKALKKARKKAMRKLQEQNENQEAAIDPTKNGCETAVVETRPKDVSKKASKKASGKRKVEADETTEEVAVTPSSPEKVWKKDSCLKT